MVQMKLLVLVVTVVSIGKMEHRVSASGNSTETENPVDMLDGSIDYIYEMTKFFLEVVIQQTYLTQMHNIADLSSLTAVADSFLEDWQAWAVHYIGFVVCFALGLVLFIVMLLACFVFPCCRCCGRCGAPNPLKQKGVSRGSKVFCSLALGVVTAGLILGAVGMFVTNETLNEQLNGDIFQSVDGAIEGVQSYLYRLSEEVVTVVYDRFLETEKVLFSIIEAVPSDAIKALDNATGVVTTLNQLNNFSSQLGALQLSLLQSESLAATLDAETKKLEADLNSIISNATAALSGCNSAGCNQASGEANATTVRVDFGVVNVSAAIIAVNFSLEIDLPGLVGHSLQQITDVEDSIASTISPNVDDMVSTVKDIESSLSDIIDDINATLNGLGLDSIQKTVDDIQDEDIYKMAVDVTYGVFLALSCVVSVVAFFNLLGLLMGWILRPSKNSESGCECTTAVGYHLLTTATAITLIFYWFISILVAVLFVSGGIVHTEMCRNIVNFNRPESAAVLSIYDDWIQKEVAFGWDIRIFRTYSDCHLNKSFFEAFNVRSVLNFSDADIGSAQIKEATESFKGTTFDLPTVNLTDPILISALRILDNDLSESSLNFTYFYANIEGNITDRDILSLAARFDSVTDVDLTSFASDLRALHQTQVVPISARRDQLVTALKTSESIIRIVPFGNIADTLIESEAAINVNGSYIVSGFVNDTADAIYNTVERYINRTNTDLDENVGRCAPLHQSLKIVLDDLCLQFLYSLNGFWYSLGWCMFFLIPNLFLSVHLASAFKTGTSENSIKHKD